MHDVLPMVKINLTYEGELRVKAIHGPSQTQLVTDAPVDNHGKGSSFSPSDLVATGLGSCMLTLMAIVAERHQIDLKRTRVEVTKEMTQSPIRRIGKLRVLLYLPPNIEEKNQKVLERAAMTCPVHQSLHPEVKIEVQFLWGQL